MNSIHGSLEVRTSGTGIVEITEDVSRWLAENECRDGLLTAMILHTSASLLIQENADPDVKSDLLAFLDRFAPPADDPSMAYLVHRFEGPDDMPAHIKSSVLPVSIGIPVQNGRMRLGTWQGLYVVEHRASRHHRKVALHFLG